MKAKLTKVVVVAALGMVVVFGAFGASVSVAAETVTIGSDRNTGGPTESDRKTVEDILKGARDLPRR